MGKWRQQSRHNLDTRKWFVSRTRSLIPIQQEDGCGISACGGEGKRPFSCWEQNPKVAFSTISCSSCTTFYGQTMTHFDPCALILLIGLTGFLLTVSRVTTAKPSLQPSEHFTATNNQQTADYGFRSHRLLTLSGLSEFQTTVSLSVRHTTLD
jgi:hypothetical protein